MHGLPAVLAAITLLACGGDADPPTAPRDPAVGLSISPPALSLLVGAEGRLAARAYDAKDRTINASVEWSSTDPAIATVRKNDGTVTAIAAGTTTVTAEVGTLRATATVSVRPPDPPVNISISPSALSLIAGGVARLTARASDSTGRTTSVSFEWSSADPAVATVGKTDGVVTAIAAGSTTVAATAGMLSATATVSVRPPDPPVAVSISPSALTLIAGGVGRLAAHAVDSTGRTDSVSFEWSSADPAVATVGETDGIVTAISAGATTVTVAVGELRATAAVSVIAFAGTFAFTRMTQSSPGDFTSDVLFSSAADRTMRSLSRPGQFASIAAPAWSPDGSRLAVEVIHAFFGPPAFEWMEYNSDLYVLDAAAPTASPWRALTTNGLSTSPSWSPDGTRIAYVQQPALWSESNDIYVIDAAGGAPVRLTRTEGYYAKPRWSPDGTRLAFDAYSATVGNSEVFIVNADGSGLTNVTRSSARDVDPSWSPDGARLAFASDRDNSAGSFRLDLFVVDVDGSNVRRLASLAEYSYAPAWSPDGRQIMFSSGASLYLMNADGSSLVRLTTPPVNSWDSGPVWRR